MVGLDAGRPLRRADEAPVACTVLAFHHSNLHREGQAADQRRVFARPYRAGMALHGDGTASCGTPTPGFSFLQSGSDADIPRPAWRSRGAVIVPFGEAGIKLTLRSRWHNQPGRATGTSPCCLFPLGPIARLSIASGGVPRADVVQWDTGGPKGRPMPGKHCGCRRTKTALEHRARQRRGAAPIRLRGLEP